MSMESGKTTDLKNTIVENSSSFSNSQEKVATKDKKHPPMHEFIRSILYQDLIKPSEYLKVFDSLISLDWKNKKTSAYAIKCLVQVWNVPFPNIKDMADLIRGLEKYKKSLAARVVAGVVEDIKKGLETFTTSRNRRRKSWRRKIRRRIAMVKYLGELHKNRLVKTEDIMKVLYFLVSVGVTLDDENVSTLDPVVFLFRARLAGLLVKTCDHNYFKIHNETELNYYIVSFEHCCFKLVEIILTMENPYYTTIRNLYQDCLVALRPNINFAKRLSETAIDFEESMESIRLSWKLFHKAKEEAERIASQTGPCAA